MRFVRCRVFGKADVAVDTEDDVLCWKFRDGRIGFDDFGGECFDIGGPVFEGAAVLAVVG